MGLVVFSAQSSVYGAIRYINLDDLYRSIMQWLSMATYQLKPSYQLRCHLYQESQLSFW